MLPLYLLAGGQSRRFGDRDKARAVIDGEPLLLRAAAALQPFASRVVVVAEQPAKYEDLGLRTIADSGVGAGPLDGLRAALDDLGDDERWLLLSGCDLIGLRPEWIDQLLQARGTSGLAVAFRDHSSWQPLPGVYHRQLRPIVAAQLEATELALWRLLDNSRVAATALPLPAAWQQSTIDVNTSALAEVAARRSRA